MRLRTRLGVAALVALGHALLSPGVAAQGPAQNAARATATFAGGCFWCMVPPFDALDGVVSTNSGYTGGHTPNPTYEQVSSGTTGHFEAIEVTYDPAKITYAKLLEVFWRNVDAVDGGGQFCDRGGQYRSAIFYHSGEQQPRPKPRSRRSPNAWGRRWRQTS